MELRGGNRNLLWNWRFIEMDLKETIWHGTGLDSSNLGQNRETCFENGNKDLVFIRDEQFLGQTSKYRVFQKDLNIYSGHRGHRTWHPVMFSYGDTLKTMPTNHQLQDRIQAAVQTIEGEQVS